ncbi:methyl-accepting chemotaxis protein TlpC [Alicyclobacillus contaminans]|uniref:methyl-accepting chemotaxis protein n=1 Tax=Alicyclobacillus contaminans TaxID=392016 RepID=UPI000556276C|nr:methyl-accepting chemotaxis protein [Alicyclobacillus contaminans]GMA50654.1 methyl-accepting chemotaxis protein TlpC [Alicyclobacillus contaminans]
MKQQDLEHPELAQGKRMRRFQNFSIQYKLMIPFTFIVLISILIVGVLGVHTAQGVIVKSSENKLASDAKVSLTLIDNQFNGNWQIINGKLWKGSLVFNDNASVMQEISAETGDAVGLFQSDVRVATSLQKGEKFAVGDRAPAAVVNTVLKQGKVFTGQETILGARYETAYVPIRDEKMQIIGMWFIGIPLQSLLAEENSLRTEAVLVGLVVLVLTLALSWLLSHRMKRAVSDLVGLARKVGDGNLSQLAEVKTGDELGQLAMGFNQMVTSLRSLISEAERTSALMASAAENMSTIAEEGSRGAEHVSLTIEQVAVGAREQVATVEGGTARVAGVTERMAHIADSARMVSSVAVHADEVTEGGHLSIGQAVQQMHSIQGAVGQLERVVSGLEEQSNRIGRIVDAMESIAGQTQLLALNAAIEAARAGEHGRGFTVVASEVKKLADQSSDSAKQVAELIQSIQSGIHQVLAYTRQCHSEVDDGVHTVSAAGTSFERIREVVATVSTQMGAVTQAVDEITQETSQLSAAMDGVLKVTTMTATAMETLSATSEEQSSAMQEVSSSATSLSQMADRLRALVGRFVLEKQ